MIRLFPKFWKLNSSSHHRTTVLPGSSPQRTRGEKLPMSVAPLPWILLSSQITGFPYHAAPRATLEKDPKCVWYRHEAAQRFGWIRTRNHETWVLNPILLFIFLRPIPACAYRHPYMYVLHCETDCICGMILCPLIWNRKINHLEPVQPITAAVLQLF